MNLKKDAVVGADGDDLASAIAEGSSLLATLGLFLGGTLWDRGEGVPFATKSNALPFFPVEPDF